MKRKAEDVTGPPAKKKTEAMRFANKKLLVQLCGRGDFLRRWRRVQLVREALAETAECEGCQKLHAEGRKKKFKDPFSAVLSVEHHFHEPEECGRLGVLVHAVANQQHLLNASWYFEAADYLWKVLVEAGEVPNAGDLKEGSKELRDEKCVRLCEVVDVVAAAVGIRAYHRGMGEPGPE